VRVDFAPETSVLADMPVAFAQAASQNARWEQGRLQLLRHRVPSLLAEGVRRSSLLRLDAAVEKLIPPLSVPFALGGLCLVAGLGLGAAVPATVAALSLGGQLAYLVAGLALVRAPISAYRALTHAPLYIAWKVGLYGRALLSTRTARWIRTTRPAPRDAPHPTPVRGVQTADSHAGGR
jgi:hypothetical protein